MKKRSICGLLILAVLLTLLIPVSLAPEAKAADVSEVRNGVVRVFSENRNGSFSTGSAFGVGTIGQETEYFVTNRHVVTGPDEFGREAMARRVYLVVDGNSYNADIYAGVYNGQIVGYDSIVYDVDYSRMIPCDVIFVSEDYDVAILQATDKVKDRVALELADAAETMNATDPVYSMGYPSLSDTVSSISNWYATGEHKTVGNYWCELYSATMSFGSHVSDMTVTTGIVSRFTTLPAYNNSKVIQHDAQIYGGNSGGPLVNEKGLVVGVNTYGVDDQASLNYAIYVDYVHDALKEMDIPYNIGGGSKTGSEDSTGSTEPVSPSKSEGSNSTILIIGLIVILAGAGIGFFVYKQNAGKKNVTNSGGGTMPPPPGGSKPRFQGVSGVYAGKRFAINGSVRIGRDPSKNDLVFPANTQGVSGAHCMLTYRDGKVYLQDLGSTYGTFLGNGKRLAANQIVVLQIGDRFSLGSDREMFAIVPQGGV